MTDLRIIWEDSALKLLMDRDRYTRNAIQEEFRNDPRNGAIVVDPDKGVYLTRVSEERFAVVWQLEPSARLAIVQAVVPISNLDPRRGGLKELVEHAVAQESKR